MCAVVPFALPRSNIFREPLDEDSGCKFEGVHRVGIGVFILNVGEVSLTDNTFHVDFMLSVFTEHYKFDTYEGAMATFDNNVTRICDAAVMNRSNPRPSDLGGKLGSRNAVNNTFSPLSPSQYLRRAGYRLSTTEVATTASDLFDPKSVLMMVCSMISHEFPPFSSFPPPPCPHFIRALSGSSLASLHATPRAAFSDCRFSRWTRRR